MARLRKFWELLEMGMTAVSSRLCAREELAHVRVLNVTRIPAAGLGRAGIP